MRAASRCSQPSRRACRSSNTHPPRSSAPSSATAARKRRKCSTWSSCCWVWLKYRRRTTPPTLLRSRSATCIHTCRRTWLTASRPRAARLRAGGSTDRCADMVLAPLALVLRPSVVLGARCEIAPSAALRRGPQRGSRVGVESCPAAVGRPKGLRYERPPLISQCAVSPVVLAPRQPHKSPDGLSTRDGPRTKDGPRPKDG